MVHASFEQGRTNQTRKDAISLKKSVLPLNQQSRFRKFATLLQKGNMLYSAWRHLFTVNRDEAVFGTVGLGASPFSITL